MSDNDLTEEQRLELQDKLIHQIVDGLRAQEQAKPTETVSVGVPIEDLARALGYSVDELREEAAKFPGTLSAITL